MANYLQFLLFSHIFPIIFCVEIPVPEFLNGEECDPKVHVGLYPVVTIPSSEYLSCKFGKFTIYYCPFGQIFDPRKQKCTIPDLVNPLSYENALEGINETTMQTTIQSTNSPNVPSTTAELTIFNKEGRNVTEKKQNGWEKLAMNDETNEIGTKLKVEKNEDLTALKVNADSGKGNGIPKIDEKKDLVLKKASKKGKVGMQKIKAEKIEEEEEKQLEQQFGIKENNMDGLPDEHYSKEREEEGKTNTNSTEILLASNELAMEEHQKLEPIEVSPCADGIPPFMENNGNPHFCMPDHGHNPFSSFSCPILYKCVPTNNYYAQNQLFHCCHQNNQQIGIQPWKWAEEFNDDYDGYLGQQYSSFCPTPGYSPISLNGHPMLCSPYPYYPMTNCPKPSQCQYSQILFKFICCQSDIWREMIAKIQRNLESFKKRTGKNGQINWNL